MRSPVEIRWLIALPLLFVFASCDVNDNTGVGSHETDSPFIRTDFSDDAAWDKLKSQVNPSSNRFRAYVRYINNKRHAGSTTAQVVDAYADQRDRIGYLYIADEQTFANEERPILVVNLMHDELRSFRVIPSVMWEVQNNLDLANMDWEDFTDHTDADGVYRGLP